MAEGPSIVILRDRVQAFVGQRIVSAEGNTPIDTTRLVGERVASVRSHGKHLIVSLDGGFAFRVHLLMLGSYCIDQRKDKPIRLGLRFENGREINFYSCSVRFVDAPLDAVYDWRIDVMAPAWDPALARKSLRALPDALVCDALLDQSIFAGVGNVIKNEALFHLRLHPLSLVGALPAAKLRDMVTQAVVSSQAFYGWKKTNVDAPTGRPATAADPWNVHNKTMCPRGHGPLTKAHLGELDRRCFYCERCQRRYGAGDGGAVAGSRADRPRPRPAPR